MSNLLLKLLSRIGIAFAYLFPNAGPEDEEPAEPDEPDEPDAADEPGDETDDPDPEPDDIPADPALEASASRAPSRGSRAIAELRQRTQEAERVAREAQERLSRLEAGPSQADRQLQEEEARLRDPNTSDQEKWQIQSNRVIRDSQRQAQQAMLTAQDMSDRAEFQVKGVSNPLYGKYAERVEKIVSAERAKGNLIKRDFVLAMEIGRDMLQGNLKSKKTQTTAIARGKPSTAKSDTPRTGSMTDRQKRASRLQDTPI